MSICHVILLLYEKTRSLGLNIDSQTSHQTSKGIAIGEKSNTEVECIFSETNRQTEIFTCIRAKDVIES